MQKFENVDILKSLKAIMQTHTQHFQSDFDIDMETLKQAAKSPNPEDKKQLWLCRPAGTWCLRERDTFIKGSREHNTFCFYAEQTRDKIIIAYVLLQNIWNPGKNCCIYTNPEECCKNTIITFAFFDSIF